MINVYERIESNKRKSWLIVGLFLFFVLGASYLMAKGLGYGPGVVGWALVLSGVMSYISYYFSDKIILGLSSARPANRERDFDFYTVAENLSRVARVPCPKLYVIEDTALNAFATGRDPEHAVVVATTGLLASLNRTQLEGVVAHELSHVKNYDTRLASIVTILVGLVALLADWFLRISYWGGGKRERDEGGQMQAVLFAVGFVLALLSPIVAQLIQLAVSRRREFLADAEGAKLTRFPDGLAQALEIIAKDKEPLEAANKATAHLYISNPLKNRHDAVGWFAQMFNTHPPVQERIKALRS